MQGWPDSSDGKRALDEPRLSGGRETLKGEAHHGSGDNQEDARLSGEGSGCGCREVPGSSPGRAPKLFVVGRRDLPPGLRMAQMFHAARQFAEDHPEAEGRWFRESNTIVLLEVSHGAALKALASLAWLWGVAVSEFSEEPDLGVTALAIGPEGCRLVSSLPLALRGI